VSYHISACAHDCPSVCSLEVERLDERRIGRIYGLKSNTYTAGVTCAKVARYAERVHHPDRLSQPLARRGRPILPALKEFLLHGVRYAYPPERGALTRGMPTGYAAPPLNKVIVQPNEPPPVWPYSEGTVRGYSFSPLYSSVPAAAARDPKLYELLALVDALRDGRARERSLAAKELESRLAGQ